MKRALGLAALLTVGAVSTARAQDVAKDVKPDHWAYAAVQKLAANGLIKGYPPDANFLGGRTLTRYEMATIIDRVLARMDDIVGSKASKEDLERLKANAQEVRDLVDGFKTQLLVIGSDLEKAKAEIEALKAAGAAVNEKLDALTGRVDAASVKADQAITKAYDLKTATDKALAKKVDVGVGKLKISGLLQAWYINPFGKSPGGNFPTPFGAVPPGRSFGGGVGDTFRLRRGEIALIGQITPQADFRVMIDAAKNGTGTGSLLQDLWVGYQVARNGRVEIGQQKTGLTEEGSRSSSQLLTVERSIMNDLPRTTGRVGDIRDAGIVAKYAGSAGYGSVGFWQDNGANQNGPDTDRRKFVTGTAFLTAIPHVKLGLWGGTNVGSSGPRNVRDRAGATFIYDSGPHFFESEFAYALDYAAGVPISQRTIGLGGYALYAHRLSKQWQLVGRYDEWDPEVHGGSIAKVTPRNHNLREYTLGFNYYLKDHNSKIQLNYIRDDVGKGGVAFWGVDRELLITNFQTAF